MKKIITLTLLLVLVLTISSCGKKKKVVSINIDQTTIPSTILKEELDTKLSSIVINVEKGNGDIEKINLDKSMITDVEKLNNIGTHQVTVSYQEKTTQLILNILSNNYIVKVVYPDNTPVTKDVKVQWCSGENCFMPEEVNESGLAEIELDDGNYYIHIDNLPEGYTYDPNAYTTDKTNKFVEIKLSKLANFKLGTGDIEDPYVVDANAYTLTYGVIGNEGIIYFAFTPSVSGKYTIKSMSMDKLATKVIDPHIYFLGTTCSMDNRDQSGNVKNNINFAHTFTAEANTTYYFAVTITSVTVTIPTMEQLPASFDIEIFN